MELFRFGGDLDRVAGVFLVRCQDDRELAARLHRDEQQSVGVWCELGLLLAREVEKPLGNRRFFQGTIAGSIIDDLDWLLGRLEQPPIGRHDRIRGEVPRIPEMGEMPLVAVFKSDPRQIRSDTPGAK